MPSLGPTYRTRGTTTMYRAPLNDLHYALDTVIGADALAGCGA